MIGKLKLLGLCGIAGCAMASAVAADASGSSLTAEQPWVTIEGTQAIASAAKFTAFGLAIECPEATAYAEVEAPATTVTIFPQNPGSCNAGGLKATITTNGCASLVHIGETVGEGEYGGTGDVVCPEGKVIEMHVYLSSTNENIRTCLITMGPQSGLTGGTVANDGGGGLVFGGAVEGLMVEKTGLCGSGTTSEAIAEGEALATAYDEEEEPAAIEISD